ncbi:MAG: hypothetical protein ABRQ24_03090 [Syntrophomonadaceae bacterium]
MRLKPKMTLAEVKAWLEEQGALCRVDRYRIKCVADIDHIRPGHWAAFYLPLEARENSVVELTDRYPSQTDAWQALEDHGFRAHRAQPFKVWLTEQYILDRNAKVERLEI